MVVSLITIGITLFIGISILLVAFKVHHKIHYDPKNLELVKLKGPFCKIARKVGLGEPYTDYLYFDEVYAYRLKTFPFIYVWFHRTTIKDKNTLNGTMHNIWHDGEEFYVLFDDPKTAEIVLEKTEEFFKEDFGLTIEKV